MYIQKVKLQNFRSFGDEGICFLFNKGINAVIGENNNGKTALILQPWFPKLELRISI